VLSLAVVIGLTTIRHAAPITISLVIGGAVVLVLLAFPLALLSALRSQTLIDRLILLLSIFGIAFHPFVVGAILRGVFSGDLYGLPHGDYCPLRGSTTLAPAVPISVAPGSLPPLETAAASSTGRPT
jgi:ABC-type dipeptide/oligopeptide/nickel transport system permease component